MARRFITVFDTETTGFDPNENHVYQIAAVTLGVEEDHVRELDEFEVKLWLPPDGLEQLDKLREKKPEVVLYDHEVWTAHGVPTLAGLRSFLGYLNTWAWIPKKSKKGTTYYVALLGGHNVDFDLKMMRGMCKRNDVFFPAEYWGLDTVSLFRWLAVMHPNRKLPENYQLGTLADHVKVPLENAHDAMADVRATVELIKYAWGSKEE